MATLEVNMANTTLTSTAVQQAALELGRMRRSLQGWLKVRALNDRVLAGTITQIRTPLPYAQRVIAARRDMAAEQDLATKLAARSCPTRSCRTRT